jgi:hypothetical protein
MPDGNPVNDVPNKAAASMEAVKLFFILIIRSPLHVYDYLKLQRGHRLLHALV